MTGITDSTDFPTTRGAFDTNPTTAAAADVFVTKLNGQVRRWPTPLSLGARVSIGALISLVDGSGRAYVTGDTGSTDFPTTRGAFDRTFNGGSDVFVTKLNASGSALAYSTFLGGADFDGGQGIAVRGGRAYVTGGTRSADYPTTADAFDETLGGTEDAFVTKLPTS